MTDHEPGETPRPGPAGERAGADGGDLADLRSSLSSLSNLATGQLSIEEMLTKVATFAVRAIPGADGAGLTLLEEGRTDTIVATDPFVTEVDAIQYGLGEGPCISAATERRTMRSGSLGVRNAVADIRAACRQAGRAQRTFAAACSPRTVFSVR